MGRIILILLGCLYLSIPAYAAATPSNAVRSDKNEKVKMDSNKPAENNKINSDVSTKSLETVLRKVFKDVLSSYSNDDAGMGATPSSATRKSFKKSGVLKAVKDLYNPSGFKNVVVIEGRFDGNDAQLIIPFSDWQYMNQVNRKLYNFGKSIITGKLILSSDTLDPSNFDSRSYVMYPVYGTTSDVYNNGSLNHCRHYYESNGRFTYYDIFGDFEVQKVKIYNSFSERLYYLGLIGILIMGVNLLWRRH